MRTIPILLITLLAGACGRKTPAPETVRPVKVTTAAGAGIIDKDFAGMATPDDAVNLAFKVAGQVLDVPVAQGQSVKKGALLAELDPRDIELQVAATRSAFEAITACCISCKRPGWLKSRQNTKSDRAKSAVAWLSWCW